MAEFEDHYVLWRCSRLAGLEKYFDVSILENKTVLELGCGYADLGAYFKDNYKCNITVSDARQEHLDIVAQRRPDLTSLIFDCDKDKLSVKYNTILHWGVLYHISNIEEHLKNICASCDYLLLETEVSDSTDENYILFMDEAGADQSFNNKGCRPSPAYVERILKENKFTYQIITDDILNAGFHNYSWAHRNSTSWTVGLRRYWIAWRYGVSSPLKG
jgi:hypothetical protein